MDSIVPYIIIGIISLLVLLTFGRIIIVVAAYVIAAIMQGLAWLFKPRTLLFIAVLLILFLLLLGLS